MMINTYSSVEAEPELIEGAVLMVVELEKIVSNLGVIFSYNSTENTLQITLQQAHALPRDEAERLWRLIKVFAISHPRSPNLVLEVAGERIAYGPAESLDEQFSLDYNRTERNCLFLMSQRLQYNTCRPSYIRLVQ
ncbi:MAG: hypothetical protein HXX20_03035 [Chloroflexi bacterium]|nr:hypothetical protein [Chloroflexota bacterium]